MPSEGEAYQRQVQNELRHYSSLLRAQTETEEVQKIEPHVPAFELAMQIYEPYTRRQHLHQLDSYIVDRLAARKQTLRVLSLGCGTGDWELTVARKAPGKIGFTLFDLNPELPRLVENIARQEKLPLEVVVADVNHIRLEPRTYDFVVCRSSLHHFVELEHIMAAIKRGLTSDGKFLIIGEVIGRNGLLLYPETEKVADRIFRHLPPRLRFNHYTQEIDEKVPNIDHSRESFEAVRSEDILPLLLKNFTSVEHVAYDAFVSLLLDFRYGPNYDVSKEEDRTIIALITETDMQLVASEVLRPTALCGMFE